MHYYTEEEMAVLKDLRSRGHISVYKADLKKPAYKILHRLGRDGHIQMTLGGSNRFGGGLTIYTFCLREVNSPHSDDLPTEREGNTA